MKWLVKTEPSAWSWNDQVREHTTQWDGVRNYQARNNMKKMALGDLCFFYHSAIKEPAIVGIVKVIALYAPEPDNPSFGCVTVAHETALEHPVSLKRIKGTPELSELALIKQSRLSVMPVGEDAWSLIVKMSHSPS